MGSNKPKGGLVAATIGEMRRRSLPFPDETVPRICVTIGAHVLNLRHKGYRILHGLEGKPHTTIDSTLKPIYGSRGEDLRVHTMIIGEPGSGKDIWKKQFFEGEHAVCRDTLPYRTLLKVTDAGLVGQKKPLSGGGYKWEHGMLYTHRDHLGFCGEFDSITKASKTSHSGDLINTLLQALDSGVVETIQGGIDENYHTMFSIIACNQPHRFDTDAGNDRRWMFQRHPPLGANEQYYKDCLTRHYTWSWVDPERIEALRQRYIHRISEAPNVEAIRPSDELRDLINQHRGVPPHLLGIATRAAMGYWFLDAEDITAEMVVPPTNGVVKIINELIGGYRSAAVDPRVLEAVRENYDIRSRLYSQLVSDRSIKDITTTKKAATAVNDCLRATGMLRVYRLKSPNGRPPEVPTGLSRDELFAAWQREHGGVPEILDIVDADGNSLRDEDE